ncbi:PTS sugar transporter subunit IIA [Pseudonocardia sp. HH130630-07]|uniref:PTS sugar transporter subunit IIA n=1 Tax=Pseudonocardia sp. HH130630-07 TaxID=1690815 RepID=UPI0008150763|nr:PTS glucose transporter subunit IIA [Pseudonocardia sp. HH130630-07]ANY09074.1 PTS glucose transporter subunit IIA [Pseudonocardia sp. HH130630-07]
MTAAVAAPLGGSVLALEAVPDPVFAGELVGSGAAVAPGDGDERATVVAPVSGTVAKLHPHAFVVLGADGAGILVHVGIDTVGLRGAGFELHVAEGDTVEQGQPVLDVDLAAVRAAGLSTVCPVILLDSEAGSVTPSAGSTIRTGETLFTLPG